MICLLFLSQFVFQALLLYSTHPPDVLRLSSLFRFTYYSFPSFARTIYTSSLCFLQAYHHYHHLLGHAADLSENCHSV